MRFAFVATSVAALIAVPLAVSASGPQMTSNEFISAVRCAAYENVAAPSADIDVLKFQLNAEARRQAPETAALARAEASAVARQAVNTTTPGDGIETDLADACAPGAMIAGAGARNAV